MSKAGDVPVHQGGKARREAEDLVRFIEAHGGKLGPFRSYRVSSPTPATRECSEQTDTKGR